jgi:cytoskeletal protein CcmA (bactofilin family)
MKLRRFKPPEVRGFLDDGTELIGDLRFSDILHFHGKLKGRIISDGELVVGESGVIEGDVEVGVLTLSGTLNGNIIANQKVHLLSTGRVRGDVCTPILKVDEGASWEGTINTGRLKAEGEINQSGEKGQVATPSAETQRARTLI